MTFLHQGRTYDSFESLMQYHHMIQDHVNSFDPLIAALAKRDEPYRNTTDSLECSPSHLQK